MQIAHIEFTDGVVRWYDGVCGFEDRNRYEGVASFHVLSKDTIYVHAMHGRITKQGMSEAAKALHKLGYRYIVAERRGQYVKRLLIKYFDTLE